jgi:hypothetical protein
VIHRGPGTAADCSNLSSQCGEGLEYRDVLLGLYPKTELKELMSFAKVARMSDENNQAARS